MRRGDDRRLRVGVLALAVGAICAAVAVETWWTPPVAERSIVARRVAIQSETERESEHERALREADARIAELQRSMDELRVAMELNFERVADDAPRPPREVGRPVVPACATATCPDMRRLHGPSMIQVSWSDLNAPLAGSAGRHAAEIEEYLQQQQDDDAARSR